MKNFITKPLCLALTLALSAFYLSAQNDISNYFQTRGSTAYAYNQDTPWGYVKFDVSNPTVMTRLSTLRTLYGGDYYNGFLYAYRRSGSDNQISFVKVESTTGTIVQEYPEPWTDVMSDLAYDHSTQTMYGTRYGVLYKINLETGVPTEVAPLTGTSNALFTLAVDLAGNMYGVEQMYAGNARFMQVNKTTGACTFIGYTGKACNYAQSMNFDHYDGTLYWCQCSGPSDLNFMTINVATGAASLIASTGCELMSFHIPFNPEDMPCPTVTNFEVMQFKGTCAKLAWTAPANTNGITGYKVYNGTTLMETLPIEATSFISDALTPGNYMFSVEAVFNTGCLPREITKSLTIKTCGAAIEGIDVQYHSDCKATISWAPVSKTSKETEILFHNGGFVTHPAQGYLGADASDIRVFPNVTTYGTGIDNIYGWSVADDFFLLAPSFIETIDFFAYQPESGTTSTITGVFVQIWNGPPNAGGSVVWGNLSTNRLKSSSFSNAYRVDSQSPWGLEDEYRPIMKVTASIGKELAVGVYWVQVALTGSNTGFATFAVPVSVLGEAPKGNALYHSDDLWITWLDGNSRLNFDLPFIIHGEAGEPLASQYNVYKNNELIAAGIEETSFTTPAPVEDVNIEWAVTQVCRVIGGESEPGYKTAKCNLGLNNYEKNIVIYPNPADNMIVVSADNTMKSIEISNILGQLQHKTDINTYRFEINVSHYNSGIYFVKILFVDGSVVNKKIVVK
jgi:hypothetical protein